MCQTGPPDQPADNSSSGYLLFEFSENTDSLIEHSTNQYVSISEALCSCGIFFNDIHAT